MMWITAMDDTDMNDVATDAPGLSAMDNHDSGLVGGMTWRSWHRPFWLLGVAGGMMLGLGLSVWAPIAMAAPTSESEEIPEEVLRQGVILEARSPLDGQSLTAQEYAELQLEIDRLNAPNPKLSPKLQQLITLLKLRKFLKTILPIVPIK